ncbi:MAG: PucR family transcriptional regulator [Erysipelothrix sp.]|nr:PucR family transcriptional regulator [Erysipelothrix sp.]
MLNPLTSDSTLNKEIKTIDVVEVPDVAKYTSENGLILTTAMAFQDNQKELISFIDSLISIQTTALCIKTSRFLIEIDKEVIDYANDNNFAIIEIPPNVTLANLSRLMFDYILGTQAQNLTYALQIQDHFSKLFIDGANSHQILDELSKILKTPTMLFNPFIRNIGHCSYFSRRNNSVAFYSNQVSSQLKGRHVKDKLIDIVDEKGKISEMKIFPIKANYYFPFYLAIMNHNELTYPSISEFAIDQARMVLSFIIYKNNQIEKSMIDMQNSFFTNILFDNSSKNYEDNDIFQQGINYGIIKSDYYQVVLCDSTDVNIEGKFEEEIGLLTYQWLLEKTIPSLKHGIVFYRSKTKQTTLLLQQPIDDLRERLSQSAIELKELLGINIHFGIGSKVEHPYDLSNSYYEAEKALELDSDDLIKVYKPTGISTMFRNDSKTIDYFIKSNLKELAYSKKEFDVELVDTLKVYLDNQCEIAKTSELLTLHRNTVIYRITRCEEILGVSLKDPETSLNLRIALELLNDL